jgi:hypothetical protein
MWTSTGPKRTTSAGSIELSPLDVLQLSMMLDAKFCDRDEYCPEVCDAYCTVCRDLLIQKGGTA